MSKYHDRDLVSFDEAPRGFDKWRRASYISHTMSKDSDGHMQRVRIGLTGLGFVFVAVLLAAALTNEPSGEAPITPNLVEQQGPGGLKAEAAEPAKGPTEPLAELGVAPGNADANSAATQPKP